MTASYQGGYEQQEQGGVSGAFSRQLGPLKVWQWGLVVAGAALLYFVVVKRGSSGSSSDTTTAFAPASTDANGNPVLGDLSNIPIPNVTVQVTQNITKKLLYYKEHLKARTNIYDKAGKVIGHFPAGKTLLLGAAVKLHGIWYYPIINMPGKYLRATAGVKAGLTPIYQNTVDTPTVTTSGQVTTAQVNSPTVTAEALPSASAHPSLLPSGVSLTSSVKQPVPTYG